MPKVSFSESLGAWPVSWLTGRVHLLLSQEVARRNASVAAYQLMRQRQERSEVERYLAGLERTHSGPIPRPAAAWTATGG